MPDRSVAIDELPALPRDQEGPVFNEPWEAHAFALVVRLSEAGYFTWSEWVTILSDEIKAAQAQGDPDLGPTYYRHWLNALERVCAEKGLIGREDMRRRLEAWRRAYRQTPHGQPVELSAHDTAAIVWPTPALCLEDSHGFVQIAPPLPGFTPTWAGRRAAEC
jgi:nitrile hydratase accessory protein